jgi:hypothetical protein
MVIGDTGVAKAQGAEIGRFDGRRVAKVMPQSNDRADKLSPLRPQTR